MGNATGEAMELAVAGDAAEVLGMIFEQQARDRDWLNEAILAGKDQEIERLTQQRNDAWDELDGLHRRLRWLFTGEPIEEDLS